MESNPRWRIEGKKVQIAAVVVLAFVLATLPYSVFPWTWPFFPLGLVALLPTDPQAPFRGVWLMLAPYALYVGLGLAFFMGRHKYVVRAALVALVVVLAVNAYGCRTAVDWDSPM